MWCKQHETMISPCLVSTVQVAAYLLVVSTHTHPFMTTVCDRPVAASSRTTCLRCQSSVISNWSLEHHNEFTVLKWPLQSPDSNPIDFLDVDECEMLIIDVANLQQLYDAVMSICTKISKEFFQHLFQSIP